MLTASRADTAAAQTRKPDRIASSLVPPRIFVGAFLLAATLRPAVPRRKLDRLKTSSRRRPGSMVQALVPPRNGSRPAPGPTASHPELLIQPDVRQILVQIVARADLPAFHIRPVGDDPIPPGQHQLVRLDIHDVLGELEHQLLLLRRVGLVHRLVEDLLLSRVFVIAVILLAYGARQVGL